MSRGKAESTWHVIRRCFAILRRLQQGPANWQQLAASVAAETRDVQRSVSAAQRREQVKRDVRRIRQQLGVDIGYVAGHGYVVRDWAAFPFDLSASELDTLGFLQQAFGPAAPHSNAVNALLDNLVRRLPVERQRALARRTGIGPEIELRMRDENPIAPDVWEAVYAAWFEQRELTFDYLTEGHGDTPRFHHVQPWRFYFSERRRFMLRGFCLVNDGPYGRWEPRQYYTYRLHNIVAGTPRVLSTKLPPIAPRGRLLDVMLDVGPEIGAFSLTTRPEWEGDTRTFDIGGGWTRVEGRIEQSDLFGFARSLLFYGAGCRVLGGAEVVGEMRKLAEQLRQLYLVPHEAENESAER